MSTIKILCFAILGMVAGNAEYALTAAPVLDFDTIAVHNANIPSSFQPKWSANIPAGINAPNGRYIYFTVVPNGGAGNVNFAPLNIHGAAHVVQQAPVAGDINIYFPADGSQPTTPEAVGYSCANIDNRENSPITEWYMQMFGVIPFQNTGNPANDYIKAGWTNPVAPIVAERIISYNFTDTLVANLQRLARLYAALPVAAPLPVVPALAGSPLAGITHAQILTKSKESIAQLIIDLENILLTALAAAPGVAATGIVAGLNVLLAANPLVIAVRDAAVGAGWAHSNIKSALSYAQVVADNSERAIPAAPAAGPAMINACMQVAQAAKDAVTQVEHIFQILHEIKFLLKQMPSDNSVGMFANELETSFKKNFRKIASTSVGRVLLYRILIEIRRHNTAVDNTGSLENGILPGLFIDERNSLRKITIDFGEYRFDLAGKILVDNSTVDDNWVIGDVAEIGTFGRYDHIIRHENYRDVTLFHEMNHWYHSLRHISRVLNEMNAEENVRHFDGIARDVNNAHYHGRQVVPVGTEAIGNYYWNILPPLNENEMFMSETKWGMDSRANYEEIRNILGAPVNAAGVHPVANTINGDDLSENLYRMCVGIPLRFGHVYDGFGFYEDSIVIDKAINTCLMQKANYNCIVRARGSVEFVYGRREKGIGSGEF